MAETGILCQASCSCSCSCSCSSSASGWGKTHDPIPPTRVGKIKIKYHTHANDRSASPACCPIRLVEIISLRFAACPMRSDNIDFVQHTPGWVLGQSCCNYHECIYRDGKLQKSKDKYALSTDRVTKLDDAEGDCRQTKPLWAGKLLHPALVRRPSTSQLRSLEPELPRSTPLPPRC